MSKKLLTLLLAATIGFSTNSHAGFLIRKNAPVAKTEQTSNAETTAANTDETVTTAAPTAKSTEVKAVARKHGFLHRLAGRILGNKDVMPQGVYILLSVFFLGWLAIGLNENWDGYNWLIALLLYVILWLPGFIYSMIMMGNYY